MTPSSNVTALSKNFPGRQFARYLRAGRSAVGFSAGAAPARVEGPLAPSDRELRRSLKHDNPSRAFPIGAPLDLKAERAEQ